MRWLSHDDRVRVFGAALLAEHVGFRVVYGVSNNRRAWWARGDEQLGFTPVETTPRLRGRKGRVREHDAGRTVHRALGYGGWADAPWPNPRVHV